MEQQEQLAENDILATLKWYAEIGVTDVISNHITDYTKANFINANKFLSKTQSNNIDKAQPQIALVDEHEILPASQSSPAISDSLGAAEAAIEAKKLAGNANSIEELKEAVTSFEGCPLKRTAMNTVFADGNPNSKIMLVGEAPGADEDRIGKPFVGLSGQLLDKMFVAIGLDRSNTYISNIVNWRPPGNRAPSTSEIAVCLPFIKRHIELVNPKILIYVGGVSAKSLLETTQGITRLRGKWFDYKSESLKEPIKSMAIFHPAFLLRSPSQKKLAWKDLLEIKSKIDNA